MTPRIIRANVRNCYLCVQITELMKQSVEEMCGNKRQKT